MSDQETEALREKIADARRRLESSSDDLAVRAAEQAITLTTADKDRLAELEQTIEQGLRTFFDVGRALAEINSRLLYRESHSTFEDYCRERWNVGGNYAWKQIRAAKAVEALGTSVPTPANEAQARELTRLIDRPDELRAAWTEASSDGSPTAPKVREAVERRLDPLERHPRRIREHAGLPRLTLNIIYQIEQLAPLNRKWQRDENDDARDVNGIFAALTPPEAKKLLRRIDEARRLLDDARPRVAYRTDVPQRY